MKLLHLAINAASRRIRMLIVLTKPVTYYLSSAMNAGKNMKAVAALNALTLFTFQLKSKKKNGKALIRAGIFSISQERD